MARRAVDSLKQKQKKQKIVAAVLGVLFLGVVAFQGPKLWKQLHPPASPAAVNYDEKPAGSGGTPTLAAPTLGGSQTPDGGASPIAAPGSAPAVADGQLSSLSRFASKDPFAQQISADPGSTGSSSSGSGSGSSGSGGGSGTGASGGSGASAGGGSASAPKPGTAVISVNGMLYTVAVGTDFPQASPTDPSIVPLFHLVSATAHTAKISVVGGSYSSGAPTVTLQENKPVTLMNTADGTRYKLILKPVGTAVSTPTGQSSPSSSSSSSQTSTTVTLPAP